MFRKDQDNLKLPLIERPKKVGFFERRRRKKLLDQYYKDQGELLELYQQDDELIAGYETPAEKNRTMDELLSRVVFGINIFILLANLLATILSGSLAVVGTVVDSAMDLSTNIIVWICLYFMNKNRRGNKYPHGMEKLETISVILCSAVMALANMMIVMESVFSIIDDTIDPEMTLVTFGILLGGCAIKIVLMVVCQKRGTPSAKVLAMDMQNDLLTSGVAIVCATVGDEYWKYADPFGAILICSIIAINWIRNGVRNLPWLVGQRTVQENVGRIIRIVIEHDERITGIEHVMIYHLGTQATVEIYLTVDKDYILKEAHRIAHPLEEKINRLEFVDRCFVTCHYHPNEDCRMKAFFDKHNRFVA